MPVNLALAAALAVWATLRLRTYLHIYQQEEYDSKRFLLWWVQSLAVDRWASLGLLVLLPFGWLQPQAPALAAFFWLLWRARQEPNPTVTAKKPLVLTARATQIWYLSALVLLLPALPWLARPLTPATLAGLLVILQLPPVALAAANALLWPFRTLQNRVYTRQAKAVLARLNPSTVAITGSFGKTGTKYLLGHILASHAPTLATPGSVNTPLGITRVVREQLLPSHAYFIAEMGAYAVGSIARLCRLAPPRLACITAIGPAHYQRFKSLEAVAAAKFEIATAAHANGGPCILAVDAMPPNLWQPRVAANPQGYLLVTADPSYIRSESDILISNVDETPEGLRLTLTQGAQTTAIATRVHGAVQATNIACAFAMARHLGMAAPAIAAALASATGAPHRLQVQHTGGQTVIDDSYNANPAGFAAALAVLSRLAAAALPPRRRILVTPGMAELGRLHAQEHARLGALAAQNADIILALTPKRIPTFLAAARAAAPLPQVVPLPTLAAARAWIQANALPNDVILIENDLPDRYESRWAL